MPLNWSTTDRASASHGVKILTYGQAKYGKTVLCSTAPNPIILSAEAGLLSVRKFKIPVLEIKQMKDLQDGYEWIVRSNEANQFETVCLDSVSEIGEVVLSEALKVAKDPRQAYGTLIDTLSTIIRSFRDLKGKHVYFAAKQEPMKDEMTGVIKYGPSIPGKKMGPLLPYFFDEYFCLRLHPNKDANGVNYRYLQTQPDLQYDAGDRSGTLAPIEPPDLTHVIRKILGV